MEYNEIPRNTKEYDEIPRNTREYTRNAKWNRMVCGCTKISQGIQRDSKEYEGNEIPRNTSKYKRSTK